MRIGSQRDKFHTAAVWQFHSNVHLRSETLSDADGLVAAT